MEEVVNGKIVVKFGGVVHTNCATDGDCPDQSTCILNATWSAFNSMCTCSLTVSRYGDSCDSLTPGGIGVLVLYILAIVIAAIASLLLGYDMYRLFRARVKFSFSALQSTLLFLFIGSMSIQAYLLIGTIDQTSQNVLALRGDGIYKRSSPVFIASNIFLAVTFFFETLGLLNISLVWVEIANATKTMSHRTQHNIQRFRWGLAIYYFFFGGAVIVLVALDRINIVTYIVIPPIVFLLTTYIWGYFRMRSAARARTATGSTKSSDNGAASSKPSTSLLTESKKGTKDVSNELKKALTAMANTAFFLVLFGLAGVIFLGLQAAANPNLTTPSIPFTSFMSRSAWVCWSVCLLIGAAYLHPLVLKNVSRHLDKQRIVDSKNQDLMVSAPSSSHFPQQSVAGLNEPAPMKKKSLSITMSPDPDQGMNRILKEESGELRERFTVYVRSKFASDALSLYEACKRYRVIARTKDSTAASKLGKQIIREYVMESAPHAVDMAHSLRLELLKADETNNFTPETFDQAMAMSFDLLKANFYHSFRSFLQEHEVADEGV
jgi:hypothetical protein